MTLVRCKHGVYSPSGTEKAEYCDQCNPRPDFKIPHPSPVRPEVGEKICPRCQSARFKYVDEYNFRCRDCGFDGLEG